MKIHVRQDYNKRDVRNCLQEGKLIMEVIEVLQPNFRNKMKLFPKLIISNILGSTIYFDVRKMTIEREYMTSKFNNHIHSRNYHANGMTYGVNFNDELTISCVGGSRNLCEAISCVIGFRAIARSSFPIGIIQLELIQEATEQNEYVSKILTLLLYLENL